GSGLGEGEGDARADAAPRAGHERDFAVESEAVEDHGPSDGRMGTLTMLRMPEHTLHRRRRWVAIHDTHEFFRSLTIVLGIAGVTTCVFQRLRQPGVLGYLLAGMIVGPHVAVPVVANEEIVRTLSELGVVLLMFALGLEFSLSKLAAVGPTA